MKVFIYKIKNISNKINAFNTKYQIPRNSASLSFFMLVSLVSILVIAIQIIAVSSDIIQTFLLPRVINIFSQNFSDALENALPNFSFTGFSVLILINLFWSASRTINALNRMADYIYYEIKPRTGWKSRISAFLMFSMLVLVIFFEILLIFISNYIINNVLGVNQYIVRIIQFVLDLFAIFLTLLILYMYAPPKKMKVKDAYKGAILATLLIYFVLAIFLFLINAMNKIGIAYTIITVISFSLIVLFVVNYIIIIGMILNYYGNIFQLKSSVFSKH